MRPRGELIDDQFSVLSDEHLDAQDANRVQPFHVLTPGNLAKGQRFSGNSISGKRELFAQNTYSEFAHSAADSVFLLAAKLEGRVIACFDSLNMAAERRDDQATHTWKISSEALTKTMTKLPYDTVDAIFV